MFSWDFIDSDNWNVSTLKVEGFEISDYVILPQVNPSTKKWVNMARGTEVVIRWLKVD